MYGLPVLVAERGKEEMNEEFISKKALKERFKLRVNWLKKDTHDQYSLGLFHGAEYDAKLVDEIPVAEVRAVVHAQKADSAISATKLMCTACYSDADRDAVFCKYCGATFDGGSTNE